MIHPSWIKKLLHLLSSMRWVSFYVDVAASWRSNSLGRHREPWKVYQGPNVKPLKVIRIRQYRKARSQLLGWEKNRFIRGLQWLPHSKLIRGKVQKLPPKNVEFLWLLEVPSICVFFCFSRLHLHITGGVNSLVRWRWRDNAMVFR